MALRPVPWSTTPCSICRISAAVSDEITRVPSAGWKAIVCGVLCGIIVPATMRGGTCTPSLAIVEISEMSCSGEIPISWPMEIAPMETFDQRSTGFVRPRDFLFQSGRNGHHLESRPRLVDVANRAVFQSLVANLLPNIRIERGPVRESQNLAGVGIFHDHRARDGVRLFHPAFEFPLGDVLNVLIDGEHDTVAGFGLLFNTGKPALARVDGNHQLAGLALQLLVELPLQAAQSLIVGANVPQNLRRQLTFWIKTLRFFLVVDALQIKLTDALDHFGVGPSRHPAESPASPA